MIRAHSKLFESDGEHVTLPGSYCMQECSLFRLLCGALGNATTVQHQEAEKKSHHEKRVLLLFSFEFYSNRTEIIRFNVQNISETQVEAI